MSVRPLLPCVHGDLPGDRRNITSCTPESFEANGVTVREKDTVRCFTFRVKL